MWLSRRLTERKSGYPAELGQVTGSGEQLTAAGSAEVRGIRMLSPYGFTGMPPRGENVLIIPCGDGAVCAGMAAEQPDVAEGEIRIFSLGGAEIRLKNNGDVVINGAVIDASGSIFPAQEREE